jgi:hypothetical protein
MGGTVLPRLSLNLTAGWQQSPDEHGGQPRITRLINARIEAPNRILKSPGQAAVSKTTIPALTGGTVVPLLYTNSANGTPLCVTRQAGYGLDGLLITKGDHSGANTTWVIPDPDDLVKAKTFIVKEEQPRIQSIFTREGCSYDAPGVMTFAGNVRYVVVVAQALVGWTGADSGVFDTAELHWALVDTTDLHVKASGVKTLDTLAAATRCFPVVAGPYLICYTAADTVTVFEFRFATDIGLFPLVSFAVGTSISNNTNLDASYDSIANRLHIVDAVGNWYLYNCTTWAQTHSSSLSLTTPQTGTVGISVCSTIYAGRAYVVWRSSTTVWKCAVFTLTDSLLTPVLAATTIFTSPNILSAPQQVQWRAEVTAWGQSTWAQTEGAAVALYQNYSAVDSQDVSGVVRCFNSSGVYNPNSLGYDMHSSKPASKPIVVSDGKATINPCPRLWAYQNQIRTLRCAMLLSQSSEAITQGQVVQSQVRMLASAFRGGFVPPTPKSRIVGAVNASVYTYFPKGIEQVDSYGWLTAICRQKSAFTDSLDVFLVAVRDTDHCELSGFATERLQAAHCRGTTILSSAVPSQYSSNSEISGHQYSPQIPILTIVGAGAQPAAGAYVYCVVREFRDANGNVHRSPVSDPVALTHTGGSVRVDVYDDPWQSGVQESRTKIYRTKASGSVFYEITEGGTWTPGTTNEPNQYTDGLSDAFILTQEILYTQGSSGGMSGSLPTWGAPGCRYLWAGPDRAIAGGLEVGSQVRWSNLYYPGEGVSWPEHGDFYADFEEPITAVALIDGVWLVFSRNSVWGITGHGPDATGSGSFDPPRKLVYGIGAVYWGSVVETPAGVMFQAVNAQIYVVQRGTLNVIQVSQPIRDAIGKTPEVSTNLSLEGAGDKRDPFNWVISAVFDPYIQEVWFVEKSSRAWVYQIEFGAWRSEINTAANGKTAIAGGLMTCRANNGSGGLSVTSPTFVWWDGTYVGYRVRQKDEYFSLRDALDGARTMAFHTSDIDLWRGRIRRAWFRFHRLLDELLPTVMPCKTGFWFDGACTNQAADEIQNYALDSSVDSNRFLDLECCPARQKCNQFRIYWQDVPDATTLDMAWFLTDLSFEIETAPSGKGPIRAVRGNARFR